jgi:hypothetical protein
MYHVFQTAPGNLDALQLNKCENLRVVATAGQGDEADRHCAYHGWRGENRFFSEAKTAEDAVRDAINGGYCYISPEGMDGLQRTLGRMSALLQGEP